MATHSSVLAWSSPWTEEPGGLQTMGSQRGGRLKQLGMHAGTKWVQIPKRGSSYVPCHATGRQSAVSSWWDHVLDTGLSSRHYVLNRVTKQNVPREDQQSKQGDVTKETAWITGDD